MIRAKFSCNSVEEVKQREYNNDTRSFDEEPVKVGESVSFYAVYDSNPESPNYKWSKSSPSGNFSIYISNPGAWGNFVAGKYYFIDVSSAED